MIAWPRWRPSSAFVFVCTAVYLFALVGELSGRGGPGGSMWLFWLPFWAGLSLEGVTGGLGGRHRARPDRPDGRAALAGVAYALGIAGLLGSGIVAAFDAVAFAAATDPADVGLFFTAFVAVGSLVILATVARPANWVRQFNAEQADRLAAAEDALATARTRVLQSQMQPHFLFNALNSVTALMREDPARARDVLLSLKGLMERTLATVQRPMTTVRDEVAFVRDQLAIERERFHDRLTVSFNIDPDLLDHPIPAFSLQPLAENALRHGIARSIEGGDIVVRVARWGPAGRGIELAVENTGAGLDPRWREGTGLGNLRARLLSVYGRHAELSIQRAGDRSVASIRLHALETASE